MKKRILAVSLMIVLLAMLFTGCGSANMKGMTASSTTASSPVYASGSSADYAYDNGYYEESVSDYYYENEPAEFVSTGGVADIIGAAAQTVNINTDKIIYTAYSTVETLEFDKTVNDVYGLLERFGAYIESSSVTGTDYSTMYYGGKKYRTANYSIRVPVQNYSNLSTSLTELGNVIDFSSNAENITSRFVDTESRLKAYRTEYDRLLAMMEQAETVDEMITVEARLSEVEYNIESLTGTLRNWQDQVDYSTIHIYIREVHEYTEQPVEPITFGERLVESVKESLEWLLEAIQSFIIFIIAIIPWLIIPAIIIIIIVILIKRSCRKRREARARLYAERAAEAQKNAEVKDNTEAEEKDLQ